VLRAVIAFISVSFGAQLGIVGQGQGPAELGLSSQY
jgi:hypothetical protein